MKKLKNFIITLFLVIILSISTTCFADTNETQEDITQSKNIISKNINISINDLIHINIISI